MQVTRKTDDEAAADSEVVELRSCDPRPAGASERAAVASAFDKLGGRVSNKKLRSVERKRSGALFEICETTGHEEKVHQNN